MLSRAEQIQSIYQQAIQLDGTEQSRYVLEACGDDQSLLMEVRRLLANDLADQTVIDAEEQVSVALPQQIGRYRVRRLLGTGGMGAVYEAMQDKPRRKVAVKVMRNGLSSRKASRRFEYESQILGRLSHTGIAQVFEAGTYDDGTGGVPYFAMEYIAGAKTIQEYALERPLDRRQILELFILVCDAVHHGHTKGVIHRDLKPGNILVDRDGNPRIIDFGVARATDSDMAVTTLQTDVGQLIGTIQYMSPEQCEADPDILDTRSDVYALGVILFELLSGKLPYELKTVPVFEAASIIREKSAKRLSTLDRGLRGDLETIVAKAIEKDRDRRYQSALELKQDIERYLRGDAIEARPPSIAYQLRLLTRRNKAIVTTVVSILIVMIAATIWSLLERSRALHAKSQTAAALVEAEASRKAAELEALRSEKVAGFLKHLVSMASPKVAQGELLTMNQILDRTSADVDEQFADLPLVKAQIRNMLGSLYFNQGRIPEAERNLRDAITLMEAHELDDIEKILETRLLLVDLLILSERLDNVDNLSESLLSECRTRLDEDSLVTLHAVQTRMAYCFKMAQYEDAQILIDELSEGYARLLGPDSEEALTIRGYELGMQVMHAVMSSSSETKAELMEQCKADYEVLKNTCERRLGARHPVTLEAILSSGIVEYLAQDIVAAQETLSGAVKDAKLVLGENHPKTLEAQTYIGQILLMLGNIDDAKINLEEALEGFERTTGLETPTAQTTAGALANIYLSEENYEESIRIAKGVTQALDRQLGPSHPSTVQARAVYAAALCMGGRLDEDRATVRQSIQDLSSMFDSLDSRVINQRLTQAVGFLMLEEDEDIEEGVRLLNGILEEQLAVNGPDDETAVNILLYAMRHAGKTSQINPFLEWLRMLHDRVRKNHGPEDKWLLSCAKSACFIVWETEGEHDEVVDPIIEDLTSRVRALELEDPKVELNLNFARVILLSRSGASEKARVLAESTLQRGQGHLPEDDRLMRSLQEWISDNP